MSVAGSITAQEPIAICNTIWIPEALAVGIIRSVILSVILTSMESVAVTCGCKVDKNGVIRVRIAVVPLAACQISRTRIRWADHKSRVYYHIDSDARITSAASSAEDWPVPRSRSDVAYPNMGNVGNVRHPNVRVHRGMGPIRYPGMCGSPACESGTEQYDHSNRRRRG